MLNSSDSWVRGAMRGLANFAHQRDWRLLHYRSANASDLLGSGLIPDAAVLGPSFFGLWPAQLSECATVSVNVDRSAEGMACVELDGAAAAELAAHHLLSRGYRCLTTFRSAAWGTLREQHFRDTATALGASLAPPWEAHFAGPPEIGEGSEEVLQWLLKLPKPCGIFALCDSWARFLARYARILNLRIPEDIALIGVDDDVFECEVESPPLSSVAVPWYDFEDIVGRIIQLKLDGKEPRNQRILVPPLDVVIRRSSDGLAIDDPLVASAVRWIMDNCSATLTVPTIARAVRSTRQRLERRFRSELGRTIMEELRRARVERARKLLWSTQLSLGEVAKRCGFASASGLSVAFHRVVGIPPGKYRKRAQLASLDDGAGILSESSGATPKHQSEG